MNAGALVYCLLDGEGEFTPEGYELVDTANAGDYQLKLWRGTSHVRGQPVKFHEVSLAAKGRRFDDPAAQRTKFRGSTAALGHRWELLYTIANWIKRFGELYVGSYEMSKLSTYHRLFKHYLPQLEITDIYQPFDECAEEGSHYFRVTGKVNTLESILADVDVQHYLRSLPSIVDRATANAQKIISEKVASGEVDSDNFCEVAESVVEEVVNNLRVLPDDEVVDSELFQTALSNVLRHVY